MIAKISHIAHSLGLPAPTGEADIEILLTDSRSLTFPATSLFFAIPTRENDGHRFVRQLYERGVRNFVVNRVPDDMADAGDANILVVPDTVEALQRVARTIPPRPASTVAITGSRGKTTLKEWLFQLLEPLTSVARSPRSFNSRIGVPLSLWQVDADTDVALIEAGVSRVGEMESLARLIDPDTVIITNIGAEHDAGFPSREAKAREKALLARAPHVRTVIYDADLPLVADALSDIEARRFTVSSGDNDADVVITDARPTDNGGTAMSYRCGDTTGEVTVSFGGEGNLANVRLALAYMLHAGYDPATIARRFATLHPIATRLNVSEGVNGCSLIYDSYTSDCGSLLPALDFMKRRAIAGNSVTLILSDLRHEARGGDAYADIARMVKAAGVDRLIGIGAELSAHASLFPPSARFFSSTDDFMDTLSTSDFMSETILLKGAPEYDFGRIFEMLEARKHETVLEVNLDAVVRNYNYFRSFLPSETGLIAMVKASGYGAGSFEIARTLQAQGASYLAVAVLDEGIDLRRGGISMPIIVMNPKVVNYRSMFAYQLEPEVYSLDMLHDVIREAAKNGVKGYPIHIKLDTGMHRTGFTEEELPALMDIVGAQDNVEIRTAFSHLATADCIDMDRYTLQQGERFERFTNYMLSRAARPFKRHLLNSAGIIRFPQLHYDYCRLGVGLYGLNTLPPEIEKPLATVSSLRTVIINLRQWKAGECVGYARRGELHRDSTIATIPIGYADGMNRHFGNGAITVMVNGHEAPTVGNICMDACMIDVTGIDCAEGDAVEIFGPSMPIQRLADLLDTIPYEIATSISPRVKRVYYRE